MKEVLCPTHGVPVGRGRGKCPDCARIAGLEALKLQDKIAAKVGKAALFEEHEDTDEMPPFKYRCLELESELEHALKDRDERERARSKLSVENMRLRLAAEAAAEEARQLREMLEQARTRGLAEGVPFPPAPKAAAGAGVRTSDDKNVQSCTECQKSKIRCDGVAPDVCSSCARKGKTCEYKDPAKRGPKRKRSEMTGSGAGWAVDE